ncbi:MAG: argininosuccinate lyase [Chloroflexi bacterium]|nr:argininosuccinate lyase [Chloroflexota bacterium]MCY4248101.1 argininosuccinate lyase [Chloroflexota bacterium]
MTLWGGRFGEPSDADLRRLNDSIGFDRALYAEDIAGSIAYAEALVPAGLLTADEASAIVAGLRQVLAEFDSDSFALMPGDEDIHTAVERRLIELVGAVGGKLHTGRSRNDQVATDFRLWAMRAADRLTSDLRGLQTALVAAAEQHVDCIMPGYTHMQPAQPITAAHWLLSFFWMLARDIDRLASARSRMAACPLGAGALAGTPLSIDRHALAVSLGFQSPSENSLDAVSDRDFVADLLYVCALCAAHLSRLAEDILIYSNPAFAFIILDDRYSTGSSLMPQKRNADPMELMRGKTGRLIGNLSGFLATLKSLPSGYNKDLQEDKEALFDSLGALASLLPVMSAAIRSLQIKPEAMAAALTEDLLATDLADYLVGKGLPFRQAHHAVGAVVRRAGALSLPLSALPLAELQAINPAFDADVAEVFDFARSVAQRRAFGGSAPAAVREQIAHAKQRMAGPEE